MSFDGFPCELPPPPNVVEMTFLYAVWGLIVSRCRWFSDPSAASLALQVLAYLLAILASLVPFLVAVDTFRLHL